MYRPLTLLILTTLFFSYNYAQTQPFSTDSTAFQKDDVDINFLFNYYEQEGNHSAVTGGIGTEELQDIGAIIIANIPLDTLQIIHVQAGINQYTSASTDKIDAVVSSASRIDARSRMFIGYTKKQLSKRSSYTLTAGGSIESDYISTMLSADWQKTAADGNHSWQLGAKVFFDTWIPIFPEELRGTGRDVVVTNKRNSYSFSATYTQVINKRLQGSISTETILQTGLLSTPFHRVYFKNDSLPSVEKLPTHRVKFPIGVRLNYYAADWLVLRLYNRWYGDSFGVWGNTSQIELSLKMNRFFAVYPLYRFHVQTAARYFSPFETHADDASFYTTDYDLSAFQSHKIGLGLHYAPLWGVGRFKQPPRGRSNPFKSVDVRYVRYYRSDGLQSDAVSMGMQFVF